MLHAFLFNVLDQLLGKPTLFENSLEQNTNGLGCYLLIRQSSQFSQGSCEYLEKCICFEKF